MILILILKTFLNVKDAIVSQMYQGVNQLMQHHHIEVYNGTGRILGTSIFLLRVEQSL